MVMNPQQLVLWSRLQAFRVGRADADLPFEARLANEQRWTREFADRVMEEYRRFVLLTQVAGHPVTPSASVDAAWHLHMCYTRSYWHELCAKRLGTELHHDPTEGGVIEQAKFTDWYSKTLQAYARIFDEEPPVDIWPTVQDRFAGTSVQPAMLTRGKWAVLAVGVFVAMMAVVMVMSGTHATLGGLPAWIVIPAAVSLVLGLLVFAGMHAARTQRGGRMQSDGKGGFVWMSGCGSGCNSDGRGSGCGGGGGCGGGD
jgi:hypothetical protein